MKRRGLWLVTGDQKMGSGWWVVGGRKDVAQGTTRSCGAETRRCEDRRYVEGHGRRPFGGPRCRTGLKTGHYNPSPRWYSLRVAQIYQFVKYHYLSLVGQVGF
jgi:hypothetical protein